MSLLSLTQSLHETSTLTWNNRPNRYIAMLGSDGLRNATENAILSANYMANRFVLPNSDGLFPSTVGGDVWAAPAG